MERRPLVSILIPCRDEAATMRANAPRLTAVLEALEGDGFDPEIVLKIDGSADDSAAVGRLLAEEDPRIRCLVTRASRGKWGAILDAAAAARGDLLITLDADMPVANGDIQAAAARLAEGADVVVGSRRHPDAKVDALPLRRAFPSRIFNKLANWSLALGGLGDTQCCLKGFRRDCFVQVRPSVTLGYAADTEVLARARRGGLRLVEMPVEYAHAAERGFRVSREALPMLRDLIRISLALPKATTPARTVPVMAPQPPAPAPGQAPSSPKR